MFRRRISACDFSFLIEIICCGIVVMSPYGFFFFLIFGPRGLDAFLLFTSFLSSFCRECQEHKDADDVEAEIPRTEQRNKNRQ